MSEQYDMLLNALHNATSALCDRYQCVDQAVCEPAQPGHSGVPLSECYDPSLFANDKDAAGVVRSLLALGGVLQSNMELGWTGPVIGKKYAEKKTWLAAP